MNKAVRSFNALHRPEITPTGLPNHWVFGVRHVSFQPSGDLVLVVHPQSHFLLQGGPVQILSCSTISEKAKIATRALLEAFSKTDAPREPQDHFAPWTWAAEDPELGAAVQKELEQHNVGRELRCVGTAMPVEKAVLNECWSSLKEKIESLLGRSMGPGSPDATSATAPNVSLGDSSKCHGCGLDSASSRAALQKCSACQKAWYHSTECQRSHWKKHKPVCIKNRPSASGGTSAPTGNEAIHAFQYYNTTAHKSPAAQTLIRSLNLDCPPSNEGIMKPLRRLVLSGQDTPDNLGLLFGSQWRKELEMEHKDARIVVLLEPPRGSPSYQMNAWLDEGLQSRSPRPATDSEQQELTKVREMQEKIRQKVGAGSTPSMDDMQAILTSFGAAWVEHLPVYTLALNTMDQSAWPGQPDENT